MRAVNHGLTGAAIAVVVKQPILVLPLAFVSHFVCDFIPHSDVKVFKSRKFWLVLYADMALAVVCTLAIATIWHHLWWLVIISAFTAASPDLTWLYYRFWHPTKRLDIITKFHSVIQWAQMDSMLGYGIEAAWFIIFFGGLIYYGLK
ncbi:MAG: hypothetical protein M3Q70_00445 [bacterium]|nr:hypothetical protein [bacterium]